MTGATRLRTATVGLRRRLVLVIKLTVAGGLIVWLAATGRLDFLRVLGAVGSPRYLAAGLACCALAVALPMWRFQVLARLQQLPLGFGDSVRVNMIGNFFNVFIPGGSGGDAVRAAYAVRWAPERPAGAVALPFVDRGLGLHALLVLALGAPAVDPGLYARTPGLIPWTVLSAVLLAGATLVPLLLTRSRTGAAAAAVLGRMIGGREAWIESLGLYRREPGRVSVAYALSLASAACNVLALHFMVRAAGSSPLLGESLAVAPLVILANTLPISPGGIGVAESASAALYAVAGTPGGADGMLLVRAVVMAVALCGLPFFLAGRRRPPLGPPAHGREADPQADTGRERV